MPPCDKKFEFPARGFHIVSDKVAEADYFLDNLKDKGFHDYKKFGYNFSAFVSAARSTTYALQAVMSGYPDFQKWYEPRQNELSKNRLTKFFHDLRNHLLHVGTLPIAHTGIFQNGRIEDFPYFIPIEEFKEMPVGKVTELSHDYFVTILRIIHDCYGRYKFYVDPRAIFTKEGLEYLGWTIEDLTESLGFPRDWISSVPKDGFEETWEENALKALSRYGGDCEIEQYFIKYGFEIME